MHRFREAGIEETLSSRNRQKNRAADYQTSVLDPVPAIYFLEDAR